MSLQWLRIRSWCDVEQWEANWTFLRAAEVLGVFFYDIIFTFGRRGTRSFRNYIMMSFMHLGVSLLVGEELAFGSFLSAMAKV